MALPTNWIQRADLNARLTKALEIKGQKSPILSLDNMVGPVVIVEDLTKQAEWVTPTERKLASAVNVAQVVGQNSILVIQNPANSGVIGLIERVTAFATTGNVQMQFGLCNPAGIPVNPANLFFRDRRVTGAPALRAFSGTDAVLQIVNPYLIWQASNSISAPWYETEGLVVQQGEAFGIQNLVANSSSNFSIWCQEIPI